MLCRDRKLGIQLPWLGAVLFSWALASHVQANEQPAPSMPYELTNVLWSVELDSLADSSPAIGPNGDVYVGTFEGRFYAITRDGVLRWTYQTGREIKSSPAIAADGTIYFGSRDNTYTP
jgi:hypothetical protein